MLNYRFIWGEILYIPICSVEVASSTSVPPLYLTSQVITLPLSSRSRSPVVTLLVVLLSALRVFVGSPTVVVPEADHRNSSIAPSPPNAVQVNVAVRVSLYSNVISIGPISMAGTVGDNKSHKIEVWNNLVTTLY